MTEPNRSVNGPAIEAPNIMSNPMVVLRAPKTRPRYASPASVWMIVVNPVLNADTGNPARHRNISPSQMPEANAG
jgi:hypothetical protein